jgi:hypothetical protein
MVKPAIHKNSHAHEERRQLLGNFRRRFQGNITRTLFVKVEAQRVRARLDGGLRVGEIRDAANFDPRFHLRFAICYLRWALPDLRIKRKS